MADENDCVVKHHSIRKCLVFGTVLSGETYHLIEGVWHKVDANFVRKLNRYLDDYHEDVGLPGYTAGKKEETYNKEVGDSVQGFVCLDKTKISPSGRSSVEPCDLYTFAKGGPTFIHVKVFRGARDMSHLFRQGENSIELVKFDESAREKCGKRIRARQSQSQQVPLPDKDNVAQARVIFAIASVAGSGIKSERMTLFSRISMRASIRSLKRMGVKVGFCYI